MLAAAGLTRPHTVRSDLPRHGGCGGRALLEGEGCDRGNSRAVAEGHRGCEAVGGRLLAVANAVGAGVGVWECLWGGVRVGVLGGAGYPPPPLKRFRGCGGRIRTEVKRPGRCHRRLCVVLVLKPSKGEMSLRVCGVMLCHTPEERSGAAHLEFSVLHVFVEGVAVDAGLSSTASPWWWGGGAHYNKVERGE